MALASSPWSRPNSSSVMIVEVTWAGPPQTAASPQPCSPSLVLSLTHMASRAGMWWRASEKVGTGADRVKTSTPAMRSLGCPIGLASLLQAEDVVAAGQAGLEPQVPVVAEHDRARVDADLD